uniref:K Homology domain-containing protein n=1 Tax=Caenorhabditis japonica TaxID=281687 RepID=A0A8R1E490_CAEJA
MQMLNTIVNSGTANAENTLRIVGLPDNIVAAKTMVSDFLEKFEAQKQMATDPLKHKIEKTEKICFDMPIPPEVCGLIIGRGGETMKRLRSLTNCNLNLLQSSHETTHEPKPLRIIGFPDDVEKAKSMVASIIEDAPRMKESGPGSHMPGNSTMAQSTQINVPRSSVGAIIGLKGATIKRLSDDVGVKIQFMPDDDPTMAERGIVIMGTPNKIKIAVQMITDIVNSSGAMSTPST